MADETILQSIGETQRLLRRASMLMTAAASVLKADDVADFGSDPGLRRQARKLALQAKQAAHEACDACPGGFDLEEIYRLAGGIALVCSSLSRKKMTPKECHGICAEVGMLEHLAEFAGQDHAEGLNERLDLLAAEHLRQQSHTAVESPLPAPPTKPRLHLVSPISGGAA